MGGSQPPAADPLDVVAGHIAAAGQLLGALQERRRLRNEGMVAAFRAGVSVPDIERGLRERGHDVPQETIRSVLARAGITSTRRPG